MFFGREDIIEQLDALVYDGTLSPVAKADGYFDALIPVRRLLGM